MVHSSKRPPLPLCLRSSAALLAALLAAGAPGGPPLEKAEDAALAGRLLAEKDGLYLRIPKTEERVRLVPLSTKTGEGAAKSEGAPARDHPAYERLRTRRSRDPILLTVVGPLREGSGGGPRVLEVRGYYWNDLLEPPEPPPADPPLLSPLLRDPSGSPVTTSAGWTGARQALFERWREFLGRFPATRDPLLNRVVSTEELPGFTRERVEYQVEEGVFTDGFLLRPGAGAGRRPGLVVFHATVNTQARQPAGLDASKPELMLGVDLVRRGYVVLCPRCYIFEEGAGYTDPVKRMQARHPSWKGMARMVFDGIRALDFLAALPYVDPSRLGAIGHSLGAKEALYTAAFDERCRAAVFSEGGIGLSFSNWEAVWYLGEGIKKPGFALEHHQLLSLIAPRAFLLLAGESADTGRSWAFVDAALPVYRLLGAEARLGWLLHGEGHRYAPVARRAAEEFLDRELKP